jgi:hypothetical protein
MRESVHSSQCLLATWKNSILALIRLHSAQDLLVKVWHFTLFSFWKSGLINCFPRLPSNIHSSNLSLPSSKGYRCETLPSFYFILKDLWMVYFQFLLLKISILLLLLVSACKPKCLGTYSRGIAWPNKLDTSNTFFKTLLLNQKKLSGLRWCNSINVV